MPNLDALAAQIITDINAARNEETCTPAIERLADAIERVLLLMRLIP